MTDCIFCKIVAGEIPAEKLYEDEHILVIQDINPVAPVHALIISKHHYDNILDYASNPDNQDCNRSILQAISKLAAETGLDQKGFRLINNCGAAAGQTVNHLHIHLIGGADLGAKLI